MRSFLTINKLIVKMAIGVEAQERAIPQDIEINIKINFDILAQACYSSDLSDTICYAKLAEDITQFCQNKEFYLIEELGFKLYKHLKTLISNEKIELQISKNPPVEQIKGNCSFTIMD